MEQVDTLIKTRWVLPVEPHAGTVLIDHAVAIRDGRICAVEPQPDAEQRFHADTVVELADHALLPGLINAHTHTPMTLLRGLADDLPLMRWLGEHIWPAERRWVGEEFVADGTRAAIAEMLRGGVTCFNDMYFFPEVTAEIAAQAGIRATVGLIQLDFPSAWGEGPEAYLRKGLAIHDRYRGHPLLRTAFAPHAPYTVSDQPLAKLRTYADELDIPVHMHVHETAQEVAESERQHGQRPLSRLDALGLLNSNFIAVHMTALTADEIDLVAERGVHVVHCPESNMKLASGICPVPQLLAKGVNVALGTDGAASNNDADMLAEMRSAALLGKVASGDPAAVPAATALEMATLSAARALGLGEEVGSIMPGKWADLTAVDLGGLDRQPVYNPLSQVVYTAHREHVSDVWVAGRRLLHRGHLTTLDEGLIGERVRAWGERIGASDGA